MSEKPHPEDLAQAHDPMGPDPGPAQFDERDPARQSLAVAVRSSFNALAAVMIVLALAYLASGWFVVKPGERGLVARFGALQTNRSSGGEYAGTPVFPPGSYLRWPNPFENKLTLTGKNMRRTLMTFMHHIGERQPDLELIEHGQIGNITAGKDGVLFTGDRNIAHGVWRIEYEVADAEKFVTNVGDDPESDTRLMDRLAEAAVVREVSGRTIQDVTREGLASVQANVERRLQADLDRLRTGLRVVTVQAQTKLPQDVRSAFDEVTRAEQERKRDESQARADATDILSRTTGDLELAQTLLHKIDQYELAQRENAPLNRLNALRAEIDNLLDSAGGDVSKQLDQARAAASETREGVRQQYQRFTLYYDRFQEEPEATVLHLWAEMASAVLASNGVETLTVPPHAQLVELRVTRDPDLRVKEEAERYRRQVQGRQR